MKHLKSLHTFVLADFEQQLIPALAIALAVSNYCREKHSKHEKTICYWIILFRTKQLRLIW
jgi:hypothetical protein